MGLRRLVWAYSESTDTNCGSGELLRIKAGYTGIKSRCMDMFDGEDTIIFAPVAQAKCAATWPRWRKARRV
jgi:hypothetical protein